MRGPQTTRVPSVVYATSWCHVQTFAFTPPAKLPSRVIGIDIARLQRTVSPSIHRHPHQRCGSFPRAERQLVGLPCGSPSRWARDASYRRLLPNTFTTSTCASCVPGRSPDVANDIERRARGIWRFTTPRLASAGSVTVAPWGVLFPTTDHRAEPLAFLSRPSLRPAALSRVAELHRRAPRPLRPPSS